MHFIELQDIFHYNSLLIRSDGKCPDRQANSLNLASYGSVNENGLLFISSDKNIYSP